MSSSEEVQSAIAVAEIAVPLAVGLLQGVLVLKFLKPKLPARMGGLIGMVNSRANTLMSGVQLALYLGVVVTCSAAYAPQTLDWLLTRGTLPFTPTLFMLRVAAAVAAYLCGTHLVHLTSVLSGEPEADRLEPLPLKDRRPR